LAPGPAAQGLGLLVPFAGRRLLAPAGKHLRQPMERAGRGALVVRLPAERQRGGEAPPRERQLAQVQQAPPEIVERRHLADLLADLAADGERLLVAPARRAEIPLAAQRHA